MTLYVFKTDRKITFNRKNAHAFKGRVTVKSDQRGKLKSPQSS